MCTVLIYLSRSRLLWESSCKYNLNRHNLSKCEQIAADSLRKPLPFPPKWIRSHVYVSSLLTVTLYLYRSVNSRLPAQRCELLSIQDGLVVLTVTKRLHTVSRWSPGECTLLSRQIGLLHKPYAPLAVQVLPVDNMQLYDWLRTRQRTLVFTCCFSSVFAVVHLPLLWL